MSEDRFGLPLTTQSPAAAKNYSRAVDLMLSANTGAEPLLDAALAADPEFALTHIARARLLQVQGRVPDAKAAHARAHGYFEAGDAEHGADFIAGWLPEYDRRSQLHCHLSWHQALFELARGTPERARAVYQDAIRPGASQAPPFFTLFDAA